MLSKIIYRKERK